MGPAAHPKHPHVHGGDDAPDAHAFAGSCLLVRAPPAPGMTTKLSPAVDCQGSIPIHGGLSAETHFETQWFVGKMRVVFKVPPEQQAPEAAALLAGRKRQMWVMVQGRLKRPTALDDLEYGSLFNRALRLPAPLILGPALSWLASRLGNTLSMTLRGDAPRVVGPMCAAVQLLNVSHAGQEPDMAAAEEDTRLLFRPDEMQGEPMSSGQRRSFFRHAANRAGRFFMPNMVLTFQMYDHSYCYHSFRMSVPPCFSLDMVKVLDGMPVDLSLRDRSTGAWVARFQVHHRRMLPHNHDRALELQRSRLRALQSAAARRGGGGGGDGGGASSGSEDDGATGVTLSDLSSRGALDGLEGLVIPGAAAAVVAHAIELESWSEEEEEEEEEMVAAAEQRQGPPAGK